MSAGSAGGGSKRAVLKLLQQEPLQSVASAIVYCTFQAQADEVAQYLYTQGLSALSYHAGKSFKVGQRAGAKGWAGPNKYATGTQ